ncbi:MAG: DNA polymerase III subunit gamma/tau [Dehalococcoidia bacterium]
MSAEVWYRKWRPQTFAEVVGQPHVTRTLARAVQLNRIAHAYLFCGPRGTGKTSTARILAKAVNCVANIDGQPCGTCESCQAVREGRALDLIEMDAASNRGIDEIRHLREKVGYSPNSSQYKVYLIDEVHELTAFAFDALLKTLEEPPPHVIFVLATTEAHRVPETILSRCQRFDFVRARLDDAVALLRMIGEAEGVQAEGEALEFIARRATGSLRDSVNLFEQAVAAQGRVLTAELVRTAGGLAGDQRAEALVGLLIERRLADALDLVAQARDDGRDLRQLTREAVQQLRSLLLARAGADTSLGLGDEALAALRSQAGASTTRELLRLAKTLAIIDFRADPQSPLPLELAIVECIEEPSPVASSVGTETAGVAAASSGVGVKTEVTAARTAAPAVPPVRPVTATSSGADRIRSMRPSVLPPASPATRPPAPHANGEAPGRPIAPAPPPPTALLSVDSSPSFAATPFVLSDGGLTVGPTNGTPDLMLSEAQSRFRELYERCKALDAKTGRLLNSGGCDIVDVGGGAIVVGFQHDTMVRLATSPAYEPHLRQSVKDVFGPSFEAKVRFVADVPNRLQLLEPDRPSHLLDEALKLGAKPVSKA